MRGVSARCAGRVSRARLKWSDCTCATPASPSRNASTRTYSLGSSKLRDQSNQRQPGSLRFHASTVEAQDKAGQTIAEQVVLALRGEFVPFAVNLAATEANATVQPFLPLAERLGRLFTALAGGMVDTLEVGYEGQIADYDCKVLTLGVLKGLLTPVVDEPVSFVNAPQLAEARGLVGARDQAQLGARLREPDRAPRPVPGPRDARRRHALRQAGRAADRRASTTTSWTCRRRATCSSCATRMSPG